jgi:hypothetical protein
MAWTTWMGRLIELDSNSALPKLSVMRIHLEHWTWTVPRKELRDELQLPKST